MSDFYFNPNSSDELYHYGVLGMKWGHRKGNYTSTSVKSSIARRKNEKVDKGFDDWKANTKKRDDAIAIGKNRNAAKMAYEKDKSNKNLKTAYKQSNKQYKKALHDNTTYRKGVVRKEVGQDAARKYLSEAKKVKKQLDSDPTNKSLQKQYNKLMSKHDIERANARRAVDVSTNRMKKKASIKRGMTIAAKSAAVTAATAAGTIAVNAYLKKHNVTLNGNSMHVNADKVRKYADIGKRVFGYGKYFY